MKGTLERVKSAPLAQVCSATVSVGRSAFARTLVVSALVIGAIWLLAMGRWVLTDGVVPWDSKNQFYAFYRFLASALEAGVSPFWNPYHYGGHPSVADPQSLIFAPLMVLYALFDPAPSMRTFDLLVHAHLLIGGLSIAAIGARARWPVAACVLAAVVFMFGGAAAGRLQHTGIILSYGLFPLALLLLQLALERRSLLLGVTFSVVAASIALGRNQVAMLLCFVLAAVAIAEVWGAERPLSYLRERAAVLAAMVVAGLALTAAPMLLTMQFAALSNRPAITLDHAMLGSLHPAGLSQLLVANIFGSHREDYWGPAAHSEPLVALTDDSFTYLFVGAVPVILLLWFGLAGGGVFRRGRVLLAVTAGLALLFMLGRYTPAFAWAFDWVPGVSRFRRPVDASFVFVAMLALLCGTLLTDYIREGLPRQRLWASFGIALAALAVVAAGIVFSDRAGHSGDAFMAVLKSVPIIVAVILMLTIAHGVYARSVAAVAVTAIAVAELIGWNAAFRLNAEPHRGYAVLERPSGAAAAALDLVERSIGERRNSGERPRVEVMGLGGPWQNVAMVRSLEAVNGYNPLRIGIYDRLVAPGESTWRMELRDFPASFDGYDCALARTLGLEFVLLGRPIEEVPHLASRPVADVLRAGPDVWVYRLKDPAPRLNFTRRVQVADADAVSGPGWLATSPAPDRVLIDDDTPPSASYAGAVSAGSARITSWRPARIEIDVESALGGVLALHETWYPGWIAEIDGKRVPILRADVLFRGIEVPAGYHRVVFRYAPFSLDNLSDALRRTLRSRS
ncbi:MAG: YfhO family protein [Xanthobacteraceae bacterium]|nr:YfhO family protein [Xanthobacteraceae bacterium]